MAGIERQWGKIYCISWGLLQGCGQEVMKVKGNNRGNTGKGV